MIYITLALGFFVIAFLTGIAVQLIRIEKKMHELSLVAEYHVAKTIHPPKEEEKPPPPNPFAMLAMLGK